MTTREFRAKAAVEKIINDLKDRSGIGDEFDAIDTVTQEELRDTWTKIVLEFMT